MPEHGSTAPWKNVGIGNVFMKIAAEHPILVEPPVFWEAHFNKTKFQQK